MQSFQTKLGKCPIIIGAQWGDEGKGKLIDILAQQYDFVARYAGGANAGHTIEAQGKKFVFHILPSGLLHKNTICLIGNGCVVHLPTLIEEMKMLEKEGVNLTGRLFISPRAHLLFDYHKKRDEVEEEGRKKKVGTTKRGIGPAYMDKVSRTGIRAGDLRNFSAFAQKLREQLVKWKKEFPEIKIDEELNQYKDYFDLIEPIIEDTGQMIRESLKKDKLVLIEGAQGVMLDIDHGTYPFVTSSNTTAGGACTGLGIPPSSITSVVGVVKAYVTRVGSGPFPTELDNELGERIRKVGAEYGATTGRPRRCGWFDVPVAKYAMELNGIKYFNLTKLDVLSGLNEVKIGVRYLVDGLEPSAFPFSIEFLDKVKVEYITLPGWKKSLAKCKKFTDLPLEAQKYVKTIEKLTGVKVAFIGVGPKREEMIVR